MTPLLLHFCKNTVFLQWESVHAVLNGFSPEPDSGAENVSNWKRGVLNVRFIVAYQYPPLLCLEKSFNQFLTSRLTFPLFFAIWLIFNPEI